MKEAPS